MLPALQRLPDCEDIGPVLHTFFTICRHGVDKWQGGIGHLLGQIQAPAEGGEGVNRGLHALRHREGMGKTGACTAGGAGACFAFQAVIRCLQVLA